MFPTALSSFGQIGLMELYFSTMPRLVRAPYKYDVEQEKIRQLLTSALDRGGVSSNEVDRQGGLNRGTIAAVLRGQVEMRLWHVLLVLDCLKVPASKFFNVAFPETAAEPGIRKRLTDLFGSAYLEAEATRPKPVVAERDLAEVLLRLLARGLEADDTPKQS